MTIDEGLKELAAMQYPHQVDVAQAVMAQVRQHPYLQPVRRVQPWQRVVVSSSVAAVVVALIASVTVIRIQASNEAGIGSMIAQVQDYGYYGSVEEAAVNPIEYIYEE